MIINETKLNLSLGECLLRGLAAVLLPMAILLLVETVHHPYFFAAAPIAIYMYVTAIVHFCPVKHLWRRLNHRPDDNDNAYWDEE
jgi:hypothetical protein